MCQLLVYPITPHLWRWEIWCGGALFRCGAAPTVVAAALHVRDVVNAGPPGLPADGGGGPPGSVTPNSN